MTRTILVVAPHPDDEILGCGGTLLRRKSEGAQIDCVMVTGLSEAAGWSAERVAQRADEIRRVSEQMGFRRVIELALPPTRLDAMPLGDIVRRIGEVVRASAPQEVFVPARSDVHSDHRVVFDAVAACAKWFRYPSIERICAYETISETDFGLDADTSFRPNVFVDIAAHLERKLEVLGIYASELGEFPFPRSTQAVRALAQVRGAASGFAAAEAFQLLRERT